MSSGLKHQVRTSWLILGGAAAILISLPILYLAIVYFYNWGTVEVTNRADEPMVGGLVKVYGQTLDTGPLESGASKRLFYRVHGEGAYEAVFRLESGRLLCAPGGYLDGGFPTVSRLVLNPEHVYLDRPSFSRGSGWPCPSEGAEAELALRLSPQGRD